MASSSIPQLRFGRNTNTDGGWGGDGADFDVDLLTEYLLDDGNLNAAGISFDFHLEQPNNGSTMVSPENSEDGVLPPMAEQQQRQFNNHQPFYNGQQQQPQQILPNNMATMMAHAPPGTQFPNLPNPIFNGGQQTMFANDANKRRRVDAPPLPAPHVGHQQQPILAMAGGNMLHGQQQLAAAAAQALQHSQIASRSDGRRKKSQAQIDRRRERNRILARRTRLRKKFFFESLQKEVMDLQRENQMLKDVVKTNFEDEDAKEKVLQDCDAMENLPESVLEACGEGLDLEDFSLVRSIQSSQHSFVITDPSLQDNPIVFASDDFLKVTGYSREQVLGRNCRFLQGTDTSADKLAMMRKNLANGDDVSVTLLNYTADGTPFWNKLFIAALRDAQNNIVNFIGVIVKVAAPEPGDPEHAKAAAALKAARELRHKDSDDEDDDDDDDDYDDDHAEDTVKAIEGAVDAAVAAAGHH